MKRIVFWMTPRQSDQLRSDARALDASCWSCLSHLTRTLMLCMYCTRTCLSMRVHRCLRRTQVRAHMQASWPASWPERSCGLMCVQARVACVHVHVLACVAAFLQEGPSSQQSYSAAHLVKVLQEPRLHRQRGKPTWKERVRRSEGQRVRESESQGQRVTQAYLTRMSITSGGLHLSRSESIVHDGAVAIWICGLALVAPRLEPSVLALFFLLRRGPSDALAQKLRVYIYIYIYIHTHNMYR